MTLAKKLNDLILALSTNHRVTTTKNVEHSGENKTFPLMFHFKGKKSFGYSYNILFRRQSNTPKISPTDLKRLITLRGKLNLHEISISIVHLNQQHTPSNCPRTALPLAQEGELATRQEIARGEDVEKVVGN